MKAVLHGRNIGERRNTLFYSSLVGPVSRTEIYTDTLYYWLNEIIENWNNWTYIE